MKYPIIMLVLSIICFTMATGSLTKIYFDKPTYTIFGRELRVGFYVAVGICTAILSAILFAKLFQ